MSLSKYILLALVGGTLFSSCSKWLEVKPKTEMLSNVLFSSQGGFEDALTGVYIQMKSGSAYGQNMTMTTMEQLITSWDVTSNTTEQRLGLFNYTDAGVEGKLSEIYSQEYKIISSINSILGNIDAKKDVFSTPGLYEMIKAECLALRAYCHLDLLRLFGPVPSDIKESTVLPYVKNLSKEPNQHLTFNQYKTELLKDLSDAAALVKGVDPIMNYSLVELGRPGVITANTFNPENTYMAYRFIRMNYYAVRALQARAFLWFNEKPSAYEAAMEVINAKNADASVKFRLGASADFTAGDFALTCEQIFGLYDFSLFSKYTSLYASGALKKGSSEATVKNQLYGNTGTDIREANLWELVTLPNQAKCYILKKYKVIEKPASLAADFKRIPMLRISEMYLIAIETADPAEAQTLWTTFRTARNVTASPLPADPVQLQLELVKEYRKEFFAEGQAFFAYKRINAAKASVLWAPSAATINYLPPLPRVEFVQ